MTHEYNYIDGFRYDLLYSKYSKEYTIYKMKPSSNVVYDCSWYEFKNNKFLDILDTTGQNIPKQVEEYFIRILKLQVFL